MAATAARAARARYTTFKGPALFVAFGWGLEGFFAAFWGGFGLGGLAKKGPGLQAACVVGWESAATTTPLL